MWASTARGTTLPASSHAPRAMLSRTRVLDTSGSSEGPAPLASTPARPTTMSGAS
jgi:hypothetical protein